MDRKINHRPIHKDKRTMKMTLNQSDSQRKKAMKIHEIVSSDEQEFQACANDLIKKASLDKREACDVAEAIREMFLPKLLKSEGISGEELPEGFDHKMIETDEDFAEDTEDEKSEDTTEDQDEDLENETEDGVDTDEDFDFEENEDSENDETIGDSEVDDDEIATIHITVPAGKVDLVQQAIEEALSDADAQSEDHAMAHKQETGDENNMDKKELNARKEYRKSILAAVANEDEIQKLSRTEGFNHADSEQVREEDSHKTFKGNLHDPETATLDYTESKVPTFKSKLGLTESDTPTKLDGTPEDSYEFELDFAETEIPSQGNQGLYTDQPIPSELPLKRKRVVNASQLGEFDPEMAEQVLADALRQAGVEDEDLGKITYAEGLELYKAIRTASEDREHYSPDGKMPDDENDPKDPDKSECATDETVVREATLQSALQKIMRGASADDKDSKKESGTLEVDDLNVDDLEIAKDEQTKKEAELYKARLKTAYSMSTKLVAAEILPAEEIDSYAEGLLADNLTVPAMIRQTKLMLTSHAAQADKLATASAMRTVKTASTGISFNPAVRSNVPDVSGALDIQQALRNLNWTSPRVDGTED